jgi:elongation factor Ts
MLVALSRSLRFSHAPARCGPAPCRLLASRAGLIKDLRSRTSAPMNKCVAALEASGNDVDAAVDWLRKAGVSSAHKKAARGAHEGVVTVAEGEGALAIVEVNTETDFVARNSVFHSLGVQIAESALALAAPGSDGGGPVIRDLDCAELGQRPLGSSDTPVAEAVAMAVSQLGENIVLRRASALELPAEGVLASYVHNAYAPGIGQIAAAVALQSTADAQALRELGQRLAMHVVAAAPVALSREAVGEERIQRERALLTEQAQSSGKAAAIIEKMVDGRLNKFFQEVALLEQPFIVDESAGSVRKVLAAASKALGADVQLVGFVRYQVGEHAGPQE